MRPYTQSTSSQILKNKKTSFQIELSCRNYLINSNSQNSSKYIPKYSNKYSLNNLLHLALWSHRREEYCPIGHQVDQEWVKAEDTNNMLMVVKVDQDLEVGENRVKLWMFQCCHPKRRIKIESNKFLRRGNNNNINNSLAKFNSINMNNNSNINHNIKSNKNKFKKIMMLTMRPSAKTSSWLNSFRHHKLMLICTREK